MSMAAQLQYTIAKGVKRSRNEYSPVLTEPVYSSAYPVKPSLPQSTSRKSHWANPG
jgi:hypothetical protein